MAELGRVRQNSYENYSEGQDRFARLNRRGELVVVDFWTQCIFDGRTFIIQVGTEDAPVDSTAAIDDTLAWISADNTTGYALIPTSCEITVANWTTATLAQAMIEVDRGKARYSSGGTAYVPENLRTDRPRVAVGTFYVGTDITLAAKTAVPGSIELARNQFSEDARATAEPGDFLGWRWSARDRDTAVIVDVGNVNVQFGAATADVGGYGNLTFVQLPKESMV